MPNKTFLNLDLESGKLVLNFDLSLIWEILKFDTKVLSRIRGVQFLNKNQSFYSQYSILYFEFDLLDLKEIIELLL